VHAGLSELWRNDCDCMSSLVRRWATYMTNIHNYTWLRRPSSASKVLPLS